MTVTERIHQYVQKLPESLQAEVLDFVEYLLLKVEGETAQPDERVWSNLSLALAMRGMEDENTPNYTIADLKEVFS
jgi:hypothetical protein